jgi:hypothetical protein
MRPAAFAAALACSGCVVAPAPLAVQNCRQVAQDVTVDGKTQTGYAVECPQADGTWQVVSPATVPPPGSPPVAVAPGYAYPPGYAYAPGYYAYPGYPWYFGPEVGIGVGVGRGWGGWGGRWYR